MKRKRHTQEQIIAKLREADAMLGSGGDQRIPHPDLNARLVRSRRMDRHRLRQAVEYRGG